VLLEKKRTPAGSPVAGVLVLIDREGLRVDGCFSQYLILSFRVDAGNKKGAARLRGSQTCNNNLMECLRAASQERNWWAEVD
jgi:hypothetical protein